MTTSYFVRPMIHARTSERAAPRPRLFRALGRQDPPLQIEVAGATWRRLEIYKHDSWAATALYARGAARLVCKFNRQQSIAGLPMKWLGRWLARREAAMLLRLRGLAGVPELQYPVQAAGKIVLHAVAHDYVPGRPLRRHERVPDGFFPALRALLARMHERGVAYADLHKRENILVGRDGLPYLIDFQISLGTGPTWPHRTAVMRWFVGLLMRSDDYHLRKHVCSCRPDQSETTALELSLGRPWWIRLHRAVARPLRSVRRQLLVLCGVRKRGGRAESEAFPEVAVREQCG